MNEAQKWVQKLALEPHPEGGFYKRVYESDVVIPKSNLPGRFAGDRSAGSAIYYLLEKGDFSAFHRIQADELWHHYAGDPLELSLLHGDGYKKVILGPGHLPQSLVSHSTWMAAQPLGSYSLVGCSCTPAFHFDDFEMGKREKLLKEFPNHEKVIKYFTRK